MTCTAVVPPPPHLERIVRQVVDCCRPEKIVLFGSFAAGTATGDSDIDLLVIKETSELPARVAADIAAAIDHPFPIDIVVYRPLEFAAAVARKSVFASHVETSGKVLYEAGNS
jgi:predicted nucleotidyltransferase